MLDPSNAHKMIDELEQKQGLSPWEVNFIESLLMWDGLYTPAQNKKLEEVWERHFGDG